MQIHFHLIILCPFTFFCQDFGVSKTFHVLFLKKLTPKVRISGSQFHPCYTLAMSIIIKPDTFENVFILNTLVHPH